MTRRMLPCKECGELCPAPRKSPLFGRPAPWCETCRERYFDFIESMGSMEEAAEEWVEREERVDAFREERTCVRCGVVSRRKGKEPVNSSSRIKTYAVKLGLLLEVSVGSYYEPEEGCLKPDWPSSLECGPCRHKLRKLRKQMYESFEIHRNILQLEREIRNVRRNQDNRANA